MTDEPIDPVEPSPARPVRSSYPGGRPRRSRAVSGSFARSMFDAAARGTGLIAVAVVIGIVLLQLSDDNAQPVAASGEAVAVDEDAPSGMTTTTVGPATSTTVTPAAEPEAEGKDLTVLVLNGSGRNKQAGPMSERLNAAGYQTLEPGNASLRDQSIVLCRSDHADAAGALVAATGLSASTGALQDDDFPDAGEADCVVIIGTQ